MTTSESDNHIRRLEKAITWAEYADHKPWCNEAPRNIYASDGDKCDCGRTEAIKELQDAINQAKSHE